uniref:Putative secreted protein n=1 Tax=Ixodes ricinus TaxID=34613 RepID=A0A6B0U866_IXORI
MQIALNLLYWRLHFYSRFHLIKCIMYFLFFISSTRSVLVSQVRTHVPSKTGREASLRKNDGTTEVYTHVRYEGEHPSSCF